MASGTARLSRRGKRIAALALGVAGLAALLGAVLFRSASLGTPVDATRGNAGNTAATPPGESAATTAAATAIDAPAAAAPCNAELALLESNPTLVAKRRDIAVAKFLGESGLTGLARDLAADLAGLRGMRAEPEYIYLRHHPRATSPPLSRSRRLALGPLLESAGLGRLALGWESDFQTADLTFGDREIATALQRGVSLDVLAQLVELSGFDPAVTNRDGTSLATAAAIYGRPELLGWLVERGATPLAGKSPLDDIALLPASENDAAYAAVVAQLVALGDQPRMPTTLPALARRFPDATPTLHPDAAAALRLPDVQQAAEGLRSLLGDWQARVEAADAVQRRCADTVASGESSALRQPSLANKQRHEDAAAQAHQDDPRWREAAQLLALAERQLDTGDVPDKAKAHGLMMDLWREGHYAEALETAAEWDLGYDWLVEEALRRGAPLPIALIAIERAGGAPPENAILLLAERPWPGAVELARALVERYGMDPHFVDADGRNAHDLLSTRFHGPWEWSDGGLHAHAWALAQFLAEHNVSVKPRPGFDPLDNALRTGLDRPWALPAVADYSRFLIDRGALVEQSHLELALLIAEAHPERYRLLADKVPELAG